MKVQFDFMIFLFEYIIKLIDTQEDSLMLNDEFTKVIEGNISNYDKVMKISSKMNKNVIDIMKAREMLSIFDNVYTEYTN